MSKITKRILASAVFITIIRILCRIVEIEIQEGITDKKDIWFFSAFFIGAVVLGFSFYLAKIVKAHSKFWYNIFFYFIPCIIALNIIMWILNLFINFV